MTEADWRTTTDVEAMLDVLAARPAEPGRFRSFNFACLDRIRPLLGPDLTAALDALLADPSWPGEEVPPAWRLYHRALEAIGAGMGRDAADARTMAGWVVREQAGRAVARGQLGPDHQSARACALHAARAAGLAERLAHRYPSGGPVPRAEVDRYLPPISHAERAAQADLLRCLFGNPFRPTAFDPGWRTEAVVGLARGIDADAAFARLPVLADALEDAGCADAELLAHCRGGGPHARGCHAIDRALGRW